MVHRYTASKVAHDKGKALLRCCVCRISYRGTGKVYPQSFKVRTAQEFQWKGAALTLGECAAVTIVDALGAEKEQSIFKSSNRFADLCCVPLMKPEQLADSPILAEYLGDECFVANMPKMASVGYRSAHEVLERYINSFGSPDMLLSHTVSETLPRHISKGVIKNGVLKNCFRKFGNIATCSIPVSFEYFDCGAQSNLHMAGWIAAAGMSYSVFRLFA